MRVDEGLRGFKFMFVRAKTFCMLNPMTLSTLHDEDQPTLVLQPLNMFATPFVELDTSFVSSVVIGCGLQIAWEYVR